MLKMNSEIFKNLYCGQITAGVPIKTMYIRDNSAFGMAMNDLLRNIEIDPGATASDAAGKVIDTFMANLNSDENTEARAQFDAVVDAFVGVAGGAIAELKNRAAEAKTLEEDMRAKLHGYLMADPFTKQFEETSGEISPSYDFKMVGWTRLDVLGVPRFIVESINESVRAESAEGEVPKEPSDATFRLAARKLTTDGYEAVEMSQEVRDQLVQAIVNAIQLDPATGRVGDFIRLLTSEEDAKTFINSVMHLGEDVSKIADEVYMLLDVINNGTQVIDAIQGGVFELNDVDRTKVLGNGEVIRKILTVAAYYVIYHRTTTFVNGLILPKGRLNDDLLEAFRNAGGKDEMIAAYIDIVCKSDVSRIPLRGFTIANVIDSATAMLERAKKDKQDVAMKLMVKRSKYASEAFEHIASFYINREQSEEDNGVKLPVPYEIAKAVIDRISRNVRIQEIPLYDAALEFLMEVACTNGFAKYLFKHFGVAYAKRAALGGEINAAEIDLAESGVLISFLAKFIRKNLLEKAED